MNSHKTTTASSMPLFSLENTAISASAGSGKTFQLANRFVGLLVAGFEPERIIALTFSRKAAGEMFERIIQALCNGAASDDGARRLEQDLRSSQALPESVNVDRTLLLDCLRRTIQAMHKMRVSTLDSFFTGIVQAFPFEFGLGGEVSIIDGHAETAARRRALAGVLREQQGKLEQMGEFLEEFKQATFGQEAKTFVAQFDLFIENAQFLYMNAPDSEQWGCESTIWPHGCGWLNPKPPLLKESAAAMREALGELELADRQLEKWREFLDALDTFGHGSTMADVKFMFDKLAAAADELKSGEAQITVYKKMTLKDDVARLAFNILHGIVHQVLEAKLATTAGIHAVLERFNKKYTELVRREGALTFADVIAIVSGGHKLSANPEVDDQRMYVDYRLDSHFDHWLLDEFQDTSTMQWQALCNLIDEVLQDDSGTRSLFYVGDVKQAIYGWRGGDARLFHAILDDYNQRMSVRSLARSYRSSQPVIDAVNAVFEQIPQTVECIPESVRQRWRQAWPGRHETALDIPGFVKLVSVEREKRSDTTTMPAFERRLHMVDCELLKLNPAENNISIAVLVRTNDKATEAADFLRSQGYEVALEGAFSLVDNPVVAAFASLIKSTVFPNDTFAVEHLLMTPWRRKFIDGHPAAAGGVKGGCAANGSSERIQNILETIHNHGFRALAQEWLADIDSQLDEFGRLRAGHLMQAAAEFDATNNRDPVEFLDFINEYKITDANGGAAAVQVMTVHKSKGLQFDAVFLPQLDLQNGIASPRRSQFLVKRSDSMTQQIEWIIDTPPKAIVELDATLDQCRSAYADESCYEELCTLYVAMTRAKHALYIIQEQPAQKSSTVYPSTLVRYALVGDEDAPGKPIEDNDFQAVVDFEAGAEDWQLLRKTQMDVEEFDVDKTSVSPLIAGADIRLRPARLTPSGTEVIEFPANNLFLPQASSAAAFGDSLHAIMSEIEWLEPTSTCEDMIKTSKSFKTMQPEMREKVRCELDKIIESEQLHRALTKPEQGDVPAVWREKKFEALLDGNWVSGCFDRVVLFHDRTGQIEKAIIQDYKTSQVNADSDREKIARVYAPQMQTYKKALALICNIDEAKIDTQLLLTDTGEVMHIAS